MRYISIFLLLISCGKVTHSVKGETNHNITLGEKICDVETFPDRKERAECRMLLLKKETEECNPEGE